jgi:hypothetical protein
VKKLASHQNGNSTSRSSIGRALLVCQPKIENDDEQEPIYYEVALNSWLDSYSDDNLKLPVISLEFSGKLETPNVKLIEKLPAAKQSIKTTDSTLKISATDLQRKQAFELYEQLIESGERREDALAMLGPLATEVTRYKCSFYVSEIRMNFGQLIGEQVFYDRPFMSPIRR